MLPKPNTALRLLNPFQLHELMLDSTKKAGIDYLIVDVRRTDIDVRIFQKTLSCGTKDPDVLRRDPTTS